MLRPRPLAAALAVTFACAGEPASINVTDVGFATPESVLHDAAADVYLVSNINGTPLGKDDNGFISRLLPDGTMETLRWIDGAAEGVTLNAPKGMALLGDTLFVADIDVIRLFHRTTGAPLADRPVPGATFLNDVTASPTGGVFFTDMGLDSTFSPTGTDAIWQFVDGQPSLIAQGTALGGPNGIAMRPSGLLVVSFGEGGIFEIVPGSSDITGMMAPPGGQFDGVIAFLDGSFAVSSWGAQAVYRVAPDGTHEVLVDSIPSPADIGWDATRSRLLIPVFSEDRVVIQGVD